ncbi:DUF397 domain-containing protein [Streptomyces sp. A3M-1-3]|uniref:DUF397 domain-containing protein n=1 Tax=Streptomyces sp. A3M-1-3 TaxID=2962044 RepID=UPI0020B8C3C1|nr:DUF397 domain-containing protein [Streptomyces sp. A3M-1-3]MCP3819555.1 DUF397 domain-containing protein [Streptomyces sp. A3M-1-3]
MSQLDWQKSSFSGGGDGECVELAAGSRTRVHLRESDRPAQVAITTPTALSALLTAIKTGGLDGFVG